jgi:hypothetical protein
VKKLFLSISVILLLVGGFFGVKKALAFVNHDNGNVTICHAKPPLTAANGWEEETINEHAVFNDGHFLHLKDIIPPFDYWVNPPGPADWVFLHYDGKNWNEEGQAILRNGCEIPPVDLCPNLDGVQEAIPQGYELVEGLCVAIPGPEDQCTNIDGFQETVPDGYTQVKGEGLECYPNSTPTPTATPTPEPTQAPRSEPGPAGAPVCNAPDVVKAPSYGLDNFKALGNGDVSISWKVEDPHSEKYGINYGLAQDNLTWSEEVFGHETTSTTLHFVPKGNLWWQVCSVSACGQKVCGPTLDPIVL